MQNSFLDWDIAIGLCNYCHKNGVSSLFDSQIDNYNNNQNNRREYVFCVFVDDGANTTSMFQLVQVDKN